MYKFVDDLDENGKPKHEHQLDGVALTGVSSVMDVLSKQLAWWASGLAVTEFGWTNPKFTNKEDRLKISSPMLEEVKKLTDEEYLSKLDKAYRAHSSFLDKSATKGTNMHSRLEDYISLTFAEGDGKPILLNEYQHDAVGIFAKWAHEYVDKFLFSEAHCFSKDLWVGGIADAGAILKDGTIAIIDFKSAKEVYPNYFYQTAGYNILLESSGGLTWDGEKLFDLPGKVGAYIVFPFGAKNPRGVVRYDVEENKKAFLAALTIYRQNNNINQIKK